MRLHGDGVDPAGQGALEPGVENAEAGFEESARLDQIVFEADRP